MADFTHDPAKIGAPVCKTPTFTHGKLAPCVKRPILLTGSFRFIHGHEIDSVSFILPLINCHIIILSHYHMYIISPDN